MANVGNDWTVVRTVDISGGFSPDDDWEGTNDIAGWLASNPFHYVSDYSKQGSGRLEFVVSFYDNASANVLPEDNTRVDIDLVELLHVEGIPDHLVSVRETRQIAGDTVYSSPQPLLFPSKLGVRIEAATNLPAANTMSVLVRIV